MTIMAIMAVMMVIRTLIGIIAELFQGNAIGRLGGALGRDLKGEGGGAHLER